MFYVVGVQNFLPTKRVEATRGGDNDMRAASFVFQDFGVFGNRDTTVKYGCADVRHVLRESPVFVLDLIREFTCVAENDDRDLSVYWLELLKGSKHENSSLSVSRLGLAKNIHAENSLRNALLLYYKKEYGLISVRVLCDKRVDEIAYLQRGARNQGR